MVGGDTLIVNAGTYGEGLMNTLPSGSESSPTLARAATGEPVTLSLTSGGDTFGLAFYDGAGKHHITVDGLHIQCNNGLCHDGIYVGSSNHHITIKNLSIKGPYVQGVAHFFGNDVTYDNVEIDGTQAGNYCRFDGGGDGYCQGFYIKGDRVTVINSNSHHNQGYGIQYTNEPDTGIWGGVDGVIQNNRFHHNTVGLLTSYSGPHLIANNLMYNNTNDGILVAGSTTRILNNSVYGNGTAGIRANSTSGYTVRNNALRGNGTPEIQGDFGSATVSNNLCENTSTYCNLAGNPNWVDPANGDFHLQASSTAALNLGATLAEVTSSFYGVSRSAGTYDIGAAEYTAGGPTATSLRWVTQPGAALAGASLPSMSVEILDETGARLTSSTLTITLTLASNPGAASLGGSPAVAAVAGLATFPAVTVSTPGVGYTLLASSGALATATSTSFTVTGAPLAAPNALSSLQQTVGATGAIRMGWDYTPSSTPATGFKVYTQAACTGAFVEAPNMPMPRQFETGVNLSGAEATPSVLPGTHGTDYLYPDFEVSGTGYLGVPYFAGKGMTAIRLPLRWERLQPTRAAALNSAELTRLTTTWGNMVGAGLRVIVAADTFGRYTITGTPHIIGGGTVSTADFADFWGRVAADQYMKSHPLIDFDLLGEPHTMTTEAVVAAQNAAIIAIRAAGATNRIHVSGNNWSYPQTWATGGVYGTANSVAMLGISDSLNNTVFSVHLYLDALTPPVGEGECVSTTIGPERLAPFTTWLRANNAKGYIGEVGATASATCLTATQNLFDYLRANSDVYAGWSGWAGGRSGLPATRSTWSPSWGPALTGPRWT